MGGKRTLRAVSSGPDEPAFEVSVEGSDGSFRVSSVSPAFEANVERRGRGAWSVLTEGGSYETQVTWDEGVIQVVVGGERFSFWQSRHGAGAAGGQGPKRESARADVKAPMPGKVVKVLVAVGDVVAAGQGVLLFEAMKMQNEIKSPQGGTLGELFVGEGQTVEARDRMFVIHRSLGVLP